ncbi:MAG: RluA family pseudouridine synthase [Clostridiales bacterium]|nr:RluA family pseudouridine synthase [Clostridiales bacterium]
MAVKKYRILYEDKDVLVVCKPSGLATQSARPSVPDLMSQLRNELMERGERNPFLGLVNRLDQPVEGILLIGRNQKATAELNRQVSDHVHMEKWYQALVCGKLPEKEGVLVDYLVKDGRTNRSEVAAPDSPEAKRSELWYRVLQEWEDRSLLEIRLMTGRHHQIRVQLAHAGAPIVGDTKYGKADAGFVRLALCSFKTTFLHPRTKKPMTFQVEPGFPVPPIIPG